MADFGDFVSTEDEEFDLEEVVEPWHKYDIKETLLVFYPICVGEMLNERYLVEHKIGSGGFPTVWTAHDIHDNSDGSPQSHVFGRMGRNEICMQDKIVQNVQATSHLVIYYASTS